MEDIHLAKLRQFLNELSPGCIPEDKETPLITLLQNAWDLLNPDYREDLFAYKLVRMEEPRWEPPVFSFSIERHGSTAMGSTRADIQHWTINLDTLELDCKITGYRQVTEAQPGVDVTPMADELVPYIVNKSPHDWLQWTAKGRARVLTGKIFPDNSAPKETIVGRRRRLLRSLENQLTPLGWSRKGAWWDYTEEHED
jgi:hypothetical protein